MRRDVGVGDRVLRVSLVVEEGAGRFLGRVGVFLSALFLLNSCASVLISGLALLGGYRKRSEHVQLSQSALAIYHSALDSCLVLGS